MSEDLPGQPGPPALQAAERRAERRLRDARAALERLRGNFNTVRAEFQGFVDAAAQAAEEAEKLGYGHQHRWAAEAADFLKRLIADLSVYFEAMQGEFARGTEKLIHKAGP